MIRHTLMQSGLATAVLLATLVPRWKAATGDDSKPEAAQAKATSDAKAKDADKAKESAKPKVVTVKNQKVRDAVKLKGVFAATAAKEISVTPKAWTSLKVLQVMPPGKRVRHGGQLIRFDMEKLDLAIREAQIAADLAAIGLQQAQRALEAQEKTAKLDLEAARRAKRNVDQDLARFLTVDKAESVDSANYSVKSAENGLAYAMEELKQLEEMYKADDLTEESEEIILKRQRDVVERAKRSVHRAKLSRDEALELSIPRKEESMLEAVRRQSISLDKALVTVPAGVRQAKLELEKTEMTQKKAATQLARLKRDRKLLQVKAPFDGIVYYGRNTRGTWPSVDSTAAKLRPGVSVSVNDVFMTVVKTPGVQVELTVEEANLGKLRVGLKGTASPAAYPDLKLPVQLSALSTTPISSGKFSGQLEVQDKTKQPIMPGMTCSVELVVRELPDALAVPADAIFEQDDKQVAYVVTGKDKSKERTVKGQKVGSLFVIQQGLKAGDKILTQKPEPKQ